MKTRIAMTLGLSLLAFNAAAEEPGFQWNYPTLRLIASGDPAKGEAVAKKAQVCQVPRRHRHQRRRRYAKHRWSDALLSLQATHGLQAQYP